MMTNEQEARLTALGDIAAKLLAAGPKGAAEALAAYKALNIEPARQRKPDWYWQSIETQHALIAHAIERGALVLAIAIAEQTPPVQMVRLVRGSLTSEEKRFFEGLCAATERGIAFECASPVAVCPHCQKLIGFPKSGGLGVCGACGGLVRLAGRTFVAATEAELALESDYVRIGVAHVARTVRETTLHGAPPRDQRH